MGHDFPAARVDRVDDLTAFQSCLGIDSDAGWNSRFVDLNNDSWLDLLVANGFITNEQTSDL